MISTSPEPDALRLPAFHSLMAFARVFHPFDAGGLVDALRAWLALLLSEPLIGSTQ